MNEIYIILSVIAVSLISIVSLIPFLLKKKISDKTLLILLSLSVGVLLSTVFFEFLPESFENSVGLKIPSTILLGFLLMFIIEKIIHYHHKKCEGVHNHAYSIAPINLIGDGVHNFIDGLVIAGAYAINISLGINATIAIIFHEIPQEIADFGVLLYSGMSKKRAVFFNFLSAVTAIIGAVFGIILSKNQGFMNLIIPFAAGSFIYIAASNLLPQLHRHCSIKESLIHILAIIAGIFIVVSLIVFFPE